jgi:hypothetical protein
VVPLTLPGTDAGVNVVAGAGTGGGVNSFRGWSRADGNGVPDGKPEGLDVETGGLGTADLPGAVPAVPDGELP